MLNNLKFIILLFSMVMVQIRIYLGNELSLSSTTSCLYPHKEDLFIELDHIKLYCVIVTSIGNYFES